MNSDVSTLADWIAESPSTVFFGGAGVSTESGIPDFRGANGFYFQEREIPLETVLSIDFFERHPQAYWEWFHEIYRPVEPNGAHRALASLEAAGRLDAVITQNIDGLHQRAGSRTVWELHGNWERLVCTSCGAVVSLGDAVTVDGDPRARVPLMRLADAPGHRHVRGGASTRASSRPPSPLFLGRPFSSWPGRPSWSTRRLASSTISPGTTWCS